MAAPAIRGLSLCSGYGGLDLGVDLALRGYRTACYVEREPYAVDVLKARIGDGLLDDAPIWDDVSTFDGRPWRGIDIMLCGFPCQPFSTASRGRKRATNRWPDVFRVATEARPVVVFLENVAREPIEQAARDLRSVGYVARCARSSSASVGSPHRRCRCWVVAYADDEKQRAVAVHDALAGVSAAREAGRWSQAPDSILGMDDGVTHRMDRLRALGNGVVPTQAAIAFDTLVRELFG